MSKAAGELKLRTKDSIRNDHGNNQEGIPGVLPTCATLALLSELMRLQVE